MFRNRLHLLFYLLASRFFLIIPSLKRVVAAYPNAADAVYNAHPAPN